MITQKLLGNGGRLSNQIFGIASLIGIAKRNNTSYVIPEWKYAEYFDYDFPVDGIEAHAEIKEPHFHYAEVNLPKETNFNLKGYYQSVRYFENAEAEVRKSLTFKKSFKKQVGEGYDFSKPVIAIHIRRGDYVNHASYLQLPVTYFYNALQQWSDWRECNILIFSDDIPYCKLHFECLENVRFATGNEIEDLCLGSQCQRFVLSNSTYAWWMAYLSGSKEVIRPDGLFRGEYAKTHDSRDFYPAKWKAISPDQKLDLSDVTFTIPVYWDHPDRQHNLNLSVCMIQHYCDTNVIICENRGNQFSYMSKWCDYMQTNYTAFHRTRMLNDMAREAKTPIIFNWDADIIISPIQIMAAVEKLRSGIEMCFPYDGRFARINRFDWLNDLKNL